MQAISIKQPWAWAILHAGKDVENRSHNKFKNLSGRVLIHASKSIDPEGRTFIAKHFDIIVPSDLPRGGIVGSIEVTGFTTSSKSLWFFGPYALTLWDPKPCEFIPYKGALGIFHVNDDLVKGIYNVLC
jgi:hypothetical protein